MFMPGVDSDKRCSAVALPRGEDNVIGEISQPLAHNAAIFRPIQKGRAQNINGNKQSANKHLFEQMQNIR